MELSLQQRLRFGLPEGPFELPLEPDPAALAPPVGVVAFVPVVLVAGPPLWSAAEAPRVEDLLAWMVEAAQLTGPETGAQLAGQPPLAALPVPPPPPTAL